MSDASSEFVDPRSDPDPQVSRPAARFTDDPQDLEELHRFCREGRLYDVERWIQTDRPLQLAHGWRRDGRRRFRTALEIALDRRDHSLAFLLVANGYDLTAEQEFPLDRALELRRWDLVDLFLEWGADPQQVDVGLVCDAYDSEIFEKFRSLGVDFTKGHALAYALGYHTSNKPLLGFVKRHLQEEPRMQAELDIALAHHATEGNEKGVMLCLWAGGDPHAAVLDLEWGLGDDEDEEDRYSAVYWACSFGHPAILERFQPDPALDDFEELYRAARNEKIVELLARSKLPEDPSRVVRHVLAGAVYPCSRDRPVETLRALFRVGVQWEASTTEEIGEARRDLLRTNDGTFVQLVKLLGEEENCSPEILTELARTGAMRKRMRKVGLIPETARHRSEFDRGRPERAREMLAKFGVAVPKERKPEPVLRRTVWIGKSGRDGDSVKLDRRALFHRVWSVPIDKLAEEWGLSGRGLAKACRRLKIPVPPRGYWAKLEAGQRVRRRKLPSLPPGQAEEIVIRIPRTGSRGESGSAPRCDG